ncbi:MAG: hypothetical protein JW394_0696 [Nitrospira sp.]|nr:hypothetical protein [Nitrospira sp.]
MGVKAVLPKEGYLRIELVSCDGGAASFGWEGALLPDRGTLRAPNTAYGFAAATEAELLRFDPAEFAGDEEGPL